MTRRTIAYAGALLGALLLAACGSGDGARCTALPGGARYCLQASTDLPPFDVQQQVDIEFGGLSGLSGRRETLIAQLEADASGIRFVATTPFGQKLLQLAYDNRELHVDLSLARGLDPVLLLALVQIASWPAERVRAGLDATLDIAETADGRRVIRNGRDGKDLVVVRYTRGLPPHGDLRIELPDAGVELTITNLDSAPLP